MLPNPSLKEYESRMHRVMAFIDAHIDEPLDLATLAEVAHFSPFHFHRLFSAWMGETLGDYLRRRRLELAAMRIAAQPRVPILSISLAVGFTSAEAFTRAFKKRFGLSPSAWRLQMSAARNANSNLSKVNSKHGQAMADFLAEDVTFFKPTSEIAMQVKLINRAPATIAYLRYTGPYGAGIAKFWQSTYVPWAIMNRLGPDHARYGISHDSPSITDPDKCRYDACAEVADDFVVNGGALKATIPGGQYAVYQFNGNVQAIGEAWAALLRDWLPASGFQLDARPCFEYYPTGAKFDHQTGVFECEICIPVVPLA